MASPDIPIEVWICLLCGVLIIAGNAPARGTSPPQVPKDIEIQVGLTQQKPLWNVGDEVTISARLHNVADKPLLIPDWEKPDLFRSLFSFYISVQGYPGKNVRPWTWGATGGSEGGRRPSQSEFRSLGPDKETAEVSRMYRLMVPGKAQFNVTCRLSDEVFSVSTSRTLNLVKVPGAVNGFRSAQLAISVSEQIPEDMAQRYARAEKAIVGSEGDSRPRLAMLKEIADEKHYFAAHFVHKVWKEAKDPAVKMAAWDQLVSLLEFGTAYEFFDELLDVLANGDEAPETRQRLLAFLDHIRLFSEYPAIEVAEQAFFDLPEDSQKKARDLVEKLSHGPDPFLAASALKILNQKKPHIRNTRPSRKGEQPTPTVPPQSGN